MENVRDIMEGSTEYFRAFSLAEGIMCSSLGPVEYVHHREGVIGPKLIFNTEINDFVDLRHSLREIISGIKIGSVPKMWVIPETPETKPFIEILTELGFDDLTNPDKPEYGMAACLDALPQRTRIKTVVKKVTDFDEFKIWIDVVNTALHESDFLKLEQYEAWLKEPRFGFYLGYFGDCPVSTGAYMSKSKCASVEFISTLKEYRRRGVAGDVIYRMMEDLRGSGALKATLRASHMAIGLYKSLGFKPYYVQHILKWRG